MADVSMSLDEIIKKGKKARLQQQKQKQAKGKRVKGFPTKPIRGAPQFQGRVSRNFTFKTGTKKGKVSNQSAGSNRGSFRYFNKPQPIMNKTQGRRGKQQFNRVSVKANMNVRQPRQRLNFKQRPIQQFQRNFDFQAPGPSHQQPRFIPGRNQRGRRTWAYNGGYKNLNLITPGRFANRKAKLQLAKQRVQRARALIAGRIARNLGSVGQRRMNGTSRGSGRIVVGRFGLMTTRKANLGLHRATIQQKIQRAQRAREQRVSPNTPVFRGQGGRRVNLGRMTQDPRESYPSRRGRSGRGRGRNNSPRGNTTWSRSPENRQGGYSQGRGFVDEADGEGQWNTNFTTRRIQNVSPESRFNEIGFDGRRGAAEPGYAAVLDPKIQSHILYIQKQGRRLRGEDEYDPVPPATPTVSVSYSSMSLSDRFKRFMN